MTATERLKAALAGKQRGFRGPGGERQFAEVLAADLREVAGGVTDPDPVTQMLARGAAPYRNEPPGRKVTVYADDLFAVLEAAGE